MPWSDIALVFQWWSALFFIGVAAFPLTKHLFSSWYDKGYVFAKAVGFAVVSYCVYVVGTLHFAPFTYWTIVVSMSILFIISLLVPRFAQIRNGTFRIQNVITPGRLRLLRIIILEEVVFFLLLLLWSYVKAHEPSINGLEKFMDYGYMHTIFNSRYFPAPDMWWAGGYINYYYFGHLVTALLTRLAGMSLDTTFNLMLAALFALTASMSFGIGYQLFRVTSQAVHDTQEKVQPGWYGMLQRHGKSVVAGILTSFLVTLAGNMQTLYAFTKGYTGEDVQPFWELFWKWSELNTGLGEGMLRYWYANATRFIPFTIHEFPSYSFVVSDVHGHVLSLPFVLLALGMLITFFLFRYSHTSAINYEKHVGFLGFYGFLVGILLMTNALDGPIYGGIFALLWLVIVILPSKEKALREWYDYLWPVVMVALIALVTALPFLYFFDSFATGIGVNCPAASLSGSRIGPFIFEEVEKCQHSPLWMMSLLWGFFWYCGIWMYTRFFRKRDDKTESILRILKVFFLFSIGLIIFPEFLYVKDIYPGHFRSNTMFKLGYQAFIMWSIIAGYVISTMVFRKRFPSHEKKRTVPFFGYEVPLPNTRQLRTIFLLCLIPQLFLVSIYPIFSIRSYFGELRTYESIYGMRWFEDKYPSDWKAVLWLREKAEEGRKTGNVPIIVEADGESYTDYNLISSFAGLSTVSGWGVHEWLWRGSWDIVAPRVEDIRIIYESSNVQEVSKLLAKYSVRYVVVGAMEREKYQMLETEKFNAIGVPVFVSGTTTIWEVAKR